MVLYPIFYAFGCGVLLSAILFLGLYLTTRAVDKADFNYALRQAYETYATELREMRNAHAAHILIKGKQAYARGFREGAVKARRAIQLSDTSTARVTGNN